MDLKLAGKNVLVTGAGQGLGQVIADAFATEGANVAFAYNASSEGAEKSAAAAREAGRAALALRCDVTSQDDVERMVTETVAEFGCIDILVNNAAYTETGPFLDIDPDDLQRMADVTVMGTLRVTQAVVRHMVDAGVAGSIVSLMGDSGRVGESRLAGVATTRASTMGLMKSVAKEFGRKRHPSQHRVAGPGAFGAVRPSHRQRRRRTHGPHRQDVPAAPGGRPC